MKEMQQYLNLSKEALIEICNLKGSFKEYKKSFL